MNDTFRGDTPHLIESIRTLLSLDAAGALVPHGIGEHARDLLESAAARLAPGRPVPYCAPDGTCSCAKFADDPATCDRALLMSDGGQPTAGKILAQEAKYEAQMRETHAPQTSLPHFMLNAISAFGDNGPDDTPLETGEGDAR